MDKKGKAVPNGVIYFGVFLLLAVVVLGSYAMFGAKPAAQSAVGGNAVALTPSEQVAAANSCGSNKQTTVTLSLKNGLNTTGAELDNNPYVIYQIGASSETQVASGTGLNGGQVVLDCGAKYRLKLLGGSTMNSRITGIYTQNAIVDTDGSAVFTTSAPSLNIGMVGSAYSPIVVRAYDENALARMYDASPASAPNSYKGTGVEFTSTTDNATATSVTPGSSLLVKYEIKNPSTTSDMNDYGVLVLIKAKNNFWNDVQSISYDGVALTEMKGSLNTDEAKAFSDYDYVYLIPQGKLMDSQNHALELNLLKLTGVSGTSQVSVDFAVRANYLSVDGYTVKTAAAKDTSSSPPIQALFQTTIDTN